MLNSHCAQSPPGYPLLPFLSPTVARRSLPQFCFLTPPRHEASCLCTPAPGWHLTPSQQPTQETSTSVLACSRMPICTLFKYLSPIKAMELPCAQGFTMAVLCGSCLAHCGSETRMGLTIRIVQNSFMRSAINMFITSCASICLPVKWTYSS